MTSTDRLATLTVLCPLADDEAAVTTRIAALGEAAERSPFAASGRTHFARLLVLPARRPRQSRPPGMRPTAWMIDLLTHLGRRQAPDELPAAYLLFAAAYDHDEHSPYPEHLRNCLRERADDVWSGCRNYPGWDDAAGFTAFLDAGTMPAGYVFTPTGHASVDDVRRALAVRRSVISVATRAAGRDAAGLRADVIAEFGTRATVSVPVDAGPVPDGDRLETEDWNARAAHRDAETYLDRARLRRPGRRLPPADLQDVQGLTVGYGRHRAAGYLLARITEPASARRWLAGVQVTSAAQATSTGRERIAVNVALSHAGLARLGVSEQDRDGFDPSFRAGMAVRSAVLDPLTGTDPWEQELVDGVDLLVHVSAADADTLSAALDRRLAELLESGGFATPVVQRGERIIVPKSGYDGFVEHFGFADGLSQPAIDGLPRATSGSPSRATRRPEGEPLPTGELLLGYQDVDGGAAGDVAPQWLARNGSYLVFRKLEQDVPGFRAVAGTAAAKLVGRTIAGTVLSPTDGTDDAISFAADPDGFGCPIGAHVRRVNPRDSLPLLRDGAEGAPGGDGGDGGSHDARLEQKLVRRHRMLRRGIPYGPPLPPGATEEEPPPGGRGLLFVALVGDIGRQFEFVQTQWMNDGNAFRLGRDADIFAGVAGRDSKVTVQGRPPVFVPHARPVVTCRGGEYFLMPGIAALRRLAEMR